MIALNQLVAIAICLHEIGNCMNLARGTSRGRSQFPQNPPVSAATLIEKGMLLGRGM